MESKILAKLGIDPAFIFLFMLILIVVLFVLYVNVSLKYDRLKNSYVSFMRGKDGKNLEESILTKFSELDGIAKIIKQNRADVKEMYRRTEHCIQKCGIVKYDAFNEMGGKLSFALALLDSDNTGWIMNAMHSREGCYTYVKEILKGESYVELSEEEAEALDRAIYSEDYKSSVSESTSEENEAKTIRKEQPRKAAKKEVRKDTNKEIKKASRYRKGRKKMLDIKFVRSNPDVVKENIKKKFQDEKLPLVDEVLELDQRNRDIKGEVEALRANKNKISKQIGACMAQGKREEAEVLKQEVQKSAARIEELSAEEKEVEEKLKKNMMIIPNIIDPSVPIGKDDSENVEIEKFGEPVVPDFEIPYHTEIMESFDGIDLEAAGKVAGNGFYYLMGDIARLHSAVISYARDFMIDRGFTYCVPPFMIRSNVVTGVMSFAEMDAMMYKIEGEDLYLIGTSEHSMIGKFIDTMLDEGELPKTLTSYSPCFRKEKGAHGIEERGVYRIHQFEKQEMIVVCKPEESKKWYDVLWKNTVDLFRSLDIPVRTLECCSGDLADLKVKSCDVEAWSPRQKKYFEVGSCSNLGDAQARRLGIRVKGTDGNKYFAHTLNNTVVAPPRMLIAFLENNLQEDGSVRIPEVLRPYMGGKEKIERK